MKIRLAVALTGCAALLMAASCASPVTVSTNPTSQDGTDVSTVASDPPATVTVSSPATSDGDPTLAATTPVWQICNWILYGLNAEPKVATVGQPVKIWAFVYIEDFPTSWVHTDLLVNGELVDSQVLMVNFDEAYPFSFTFTPQQAGVLDISIRGILSVNAPFTALPGGDSCYHVDSDLLTVQPASS
jgi:hypothetical protein